LHQVVAAGAAPDRELASAYLRELTPDDGDSGLRLPPFTASVYGGLIAASPPAPDHRTLFGGGIESTSRFGLFAYSAAFRYWWESAAEPVLRYRSPYRPVFPRAGPDFAVGDSRFAGKEDLRATAAFGTARLSLQG
jgi:hypothetical protein